MARVTVAWGLDPSHLLLLHMHRMLMFLLRIECMLMLLPLHRMLYICMERILYYKHVLKASRHESRGSPHSPALMLLN